MKVVIVFKPESEHARAVSDFLHEFHRQTGRELEMVNPETKEGDAFCRTYDVVEYPTMLALGDDGVMQQTWRGLPLPTISEVSYYA
mgnify:CR=1 FL=1